MTETATATATTTLWILPPPGADRAVPLPPLLRPARRTGGGETGLTLRLADSLEAASAAQGAIVLLHRPALGVIAESLARGTAPATALAEWQAETETLIGHNRRMRRRITLLELDAAWADPAGTRAALAERLGAALPTPETVSGAALPRPATADPMLRLAASALLASAPAARLLAAELEALSLVAVGPGPQDPVGLISEGVAHYLSRQTEDTGRDAEQALLRSQIQQLQATLEHRHAEGAALEARERAARDKLAEGEARQAAAEAALDEALQEIAERKERMAGQEATIAKLRSELSELRHSAGAERDRLNAALAEAGQVHDALRAEMDHAAALLDKIYASRSWRITEPVRWARRVTLGRSSG